MNDPLACRKLYASGYTAGSGNGQGLYLEVYKATGQRLMVRSVMCPLREMTLSSSELRLPWGFLSE